jgi:uncharacterized membrane protein YqjE
MKRQTYIDDPPSNGRPLGEIFRDIIGHMAEIVRAEIRLASYEFRQDIVDLKTAAICLAVAAILIGYGVVFLLLSLVYALSTVWAPWLSALVVGAGVAIIGSVVLKVGIGKLKRPKSNEGSHPRRQHAPGTGGDKGTH